MPESLRQHQKYQHTLSANDKVTTRVAKSKPIKQTNLEGFLQKSNIDSSKVGKK